MNGIEKTVTIREKTGDNHQKIKLLKLMELLRSETDEGHPLLTNDICQRLGEMGISCERRTVGKDIRLLREQGYEIMSERMGHKNAYWVADRCFEIPELKVLIDAVQAASFIPEEKSRQLIDKLASLSGIHQAEVIKDSIVRFNTRKHSNNGIFYTVDELTKAIQNKKKVSFLYYDLDENLEKVYRHEGERYLVTPLSLVFSSDCYYLLSYNEKNDMLRTYRLDRMDYVQSGPENADEGKGMTEEELGAYTEQIFRMFAGETKTVNLRFTNRLIGPIYDKFGEQLEICRVDEDTCETEVEVQVSPTFWGWVFQLSEELAITGPEEVAEEYRNRLESILNKY